MQTKHTLRDSEFSSGHLNVRGMVVVGSSPCSPTSKTCKIKTKTENTAKQQERIYTMSLRGLAMCLHP